MSQSRNYPREEPAQPTPFTLDETPAMPTDPRLEDLTKALEQISPDKLTLCSMDLKILAP